MTLRILHLSDSHLTDDGTAHQGVVDTVAAYRLTLDAFENAGPLDLVVLSGDASDDGSPASYRILSELTGDFAARHGAVSLYAMGNHDERAGFREVLANGHPGLGQPSDEGPITGVSMVAGYRVVTLDSSVPGHTHGFLDASQLQWLRTQLATNSPMGSVVIVHHPPVPPVTRLHHGIELQNPDDLAKALENTDVVVILSGHYHHPMTDSLRTASGLVPVVVTGGIVNSNDVLAAPGHERATAGSGGTLLTISADPGRDPGKIPGTGIGGNQSTVRVLPVRIPLPAEVAPEQVFDLDPDTVASISQRIAAPAYAQRTKNTTAPSALRQPSIDSSAEPESKDPRRTRTHP